MKVRYQFWVQTAAEWTAENPILLAREPGFESNTGKMKFGDGVHHWNDLPYVPVPGGGGGGGEAGDLLFVTTDGGLEYRIIGFDNTTLKGIPADLDPPGPASGLTADIKLTSVTLHWTLSTGTASVHYDVYRNGTKIASTSVGASSYRDLGVQAGLTYLYHVVAVDGYGQPSVPTSDLEAFVDPDLNQAPTVQVTTWPSPLPADGIGLIRVCGSDVDAQTLAFELAVDEGVITPTDDPSIWHFDLGGGDL